MNRRRPPIMSVKSLQDKRNTGEAKKTVKLQSVAGQKPKTQLISLTLQL